MALGYTRRYIFTTSRAGLKNDYFRKLKATRNCFANLRGGGGGSDLVCSLETASRLRRPRCLVVNAEHPALYCVGRFCLCLPAGALVQWLRLKFGKGRQQGR